MSNLVPRSSTVKEGDILYAQVGSGYKIKLGLYRAEFEPGCYVRAYELEA